MSGLIASKARGLVANVIGSIQTIELEAQGLDDRIKTIREYVWSKYIDFSHVDDMDEDAALTALEEYHRTYPPSVDAETYYLGILYFELAFGRPDEEMYLFIARAKTILERYRATSGETGWEPIEDRIEEAAGSLSDISAEQRDALLLQVADELDAIERDAAPPEPDQPDVVEGMVFVPGGSFLSGTAKSGRETKAFWIDQYPVTNAEYAEFVAATGYRAPKFWQQKRLDDPAAPVVGISWFDAYKYAAYAGKSLPTRDQWEKAARGHSGRVYPWGDEFDAERARFGVEDGTDGVAAVGTLTGNVSEYGVSDMVGNVWEWTDTSDPNDSEQKVICGGSWVDDPSFLRCDEHLAAYPKDKYDNIGFRCVRLAKS